MNNIEQVQTDYYAVPETDIYETENFYTLKLEMPGVKKENLDIEINDGQLEVTGKINDGNDESVRYAEFDLYSYNRKFRIGRDIDRNKIEANLNNGVLTLTLHKAEEVKPKKIQITVQ